MRWISVLCGFLALACSAEVCAADPEPVRVALLIGNSRYTSIKRLGNPVNDVGMIAGALRQAGFTTVEARGELNSAAMRAALSTFAEIAGRADVAVVYYGGHGLSLDGMSYLLPIDFDAAGGEAELRAKGISAAAVEQAIAGARRLHIIILDACRNGAGDDLADNVPRAGPRSVTIYSVQLSQTAEDGTTVNSPFALSFARHLRDPALDVRSLFRSVSAEVTREVGKSPALSISPEADGIRLTSAAGITARPVQLDREEASWAPCPTAPLRDPCDRYIAAYPHGRYVRQAYEHIADLKELITRRGAETAGDQDVGNLRIRVREGPRNDGSIYVIDVEAESPALGQLQVGDVITQINGRPPAPEARSASEAIEIGIAQGDGKRVQLMVERGNAVNVIVIRIPTADF